MTPVVEFNIAQIARACDQIKIYASFVASRTTALARWEEVGAETEIEGAELALTEALLCVKLARAQVVRASAAVS
jgi:hypothetical protein